MASTKISSAQAAVLNKLDPDYQRYALGTALKDLVEYSPVIIPVAIDADYHSTGKAVTIPCDFQLTDVVVNSKAASSSGTATVKKSSTAISDAIIMAVDHVCTRAGTLDDGQTAILTTDTITVLTNGANDRGIVTLIGYRT